MNKLEVQQRVLHNGKPIPLVDFNWDENTNTFSSKLNYLIFDFGDIDNCTFNTGSECTFNTGSYCTFSSGSYCTFNTGYNCTFSSGYNCTFSSGYNCTFNTSYCCTFNTSYCCTFSTGSKCTFNTGSECTFSTGSNCTFNTYSNCVILRIDTKEIIQPKPNTSIQLCPYQIKGFVQEINDKWYLNGNVSLGEHIIADGILSKVIIQKGNVYKVINHCDSDTSFIIKNGNDYAHGKTLKEAKDSLIYKIGNRDTSEYDKLTVDSVISKEEAIKMYRVITGACEYGTRSFVEGLEEIKDEYSVKEIVELTEGRYGNDKLKEFLDIN